jgi:hypothetical protein
MRRGQRQVEQVRVRLGMQIDDKSFNSLLIETQVRVPDRLNDIRLNDLCL